MTIDYIPGTTSNLVGDPAEGGAFSSGNKSELSGANTAAANAATSATAAATSEANAAASKTAAATSESNAATSATNASASATTASQASASAQGYLGSVSNLYDQFDDRYLGSKTADPVLDNDGNALLEGALYWNSTSNELKVYNGSAWQLSAVDSNAVAFLTGATFTGNVNIEKSDAAGEALLYVHNTATTGDCDAVVRLDSSSNGESVVEFYHDGTKVAAVDSFTDGNPDLNITTFGAGSVIDIEPNDSLVGRFTSTGLAVTGGVTVTGNVEAPEFVGDLQGQVIFKAKAGEALTKGDAVYVSGISGNTPVVSKADADGASTYPSFGLAASTVALNGNLNVVTLGQLTNIDTSAFSLGDTLYLSTTPGVLTNVPPGGEASKIQNVGKVERQHASTGAILVVNSGRTAATPNLNDGNIFLGNASNKAVTADLGDSAASALSTKTIADLTITSADINGGTIDGTSIGATSPNTGTFTTLSGVSATLTSADINGGTVDNTTIGATTPAAGNFTTVDIDGGTADNVVIGGSTAAAGTFTDLTVNDTVATVTLNDTNTANQTAILEESNGIFTIITRNGSNPGAFDVKTTDDGTTLTRRFRVASTGDANLYATNGSTVGFKWDASTERVGIGTVSPSQALHVVGNQITSGTGQFNSGIVFGASSGNASKSSSSNTLEEYEEGTFDGGIALSDGTNTASLPSGLQAYYTKIGRVVTCNIRMVNIDTTGMTGSAALKITGLPFNTRSSHVPVASCYTVQVNKRTSGIDVYAVGSGNSSELPLRIAFEGGGTAALTPDDLTSESAAIYLTISYITP